MIAGRLRPVLVKLHLCLALAFGAVFVMLGLTGTLIAWRDEIDAALNPGLLVASAPAPQAVGPQDVQAVVDLLRANPDHGKPGMLMLPIGRHDVYVAWYPVKEVSREGGSEPRARLATARSRQVMIDPATTTVRGERIWGEPGLSRQQLMPTLFHLHHYLLAGEAGRTFLGIAGIVLLVLVALGVALWWPRMRANALWQAVSVRHGGSWPRLSYTLHRAGGIYAAPVLATLAFSGWYLNLPKWVTPIVGSVMTVTPAGRHVSAPMPAGTARIGASEAMRAAQAVFPAATVTRIGFPRKPGDTYEFRLRQPGEVRQGSGATRLWIDACNGTPVATRDPLRAPAGDTFLNWMYPLHTGEAFGLAGRTGISAFGIMPLVFAVTGLSIWWKRRGGRRRQDDGQRARQDGQQSGQPGGKQGSKPAKRAGGRPR